MDGDHDLNHLETIATTVALTGGILYITSNGITSTDESVKQTVAASMQLSGGRRRPVLFDARKWPGGEPTSWITVINEMRTAFSAGAMVVEPSAFQALSGRMEAFGRLLIPFHVCRTLEEATTFLEPYIGLD